MRKTIKIGEKDYNMQASAYTQFKYKNDTGRKLMQDLNKLTEFNVDDTKDTLNKIDDFLEIVLRVAYTMIEEADKTQINSFEEFLKNNDNLFADDNWVSEVITLAMSPLSGGLKAVPR